MKTVYLAIAISFISCQIIAQEQYSTKKDQTETNKEIARNFYKDLWFTNNTDNYKQYVADEYIVHDIGERKGVIERAIEQKNIADFF